MISFPRSPSPVAFTYPAILFKHLARFPYKERASSEKAVVDFVIACNTVLLFVQPLKQTMLNRVLS